MCPISLMVKYYYNIKDTIRKIEDNILKEFYLLLFNYLYGESNDFTNYINYLKRRIKILHMDKTNKFCEYLQNKQDLENQIRKFDSEHDNMTQIKNYSAKIFKQLENVVAAKKNALSKFNFIEDKKSQNNSRLNKKND